MLNTKSEVAKLVQASRESALCLSSNAIEAFARALGYADSIGERGRLEQPTMVVLNWDNLEWLSNLRVLCCATERLVIAVEERWLSGQPYDDYALDGAMGVAFYLNGDELCACPVVLHQSRSGQARLCSNDLTYEYVTFVDGTAGWTKLPRAFTKRAAIGVQRAGEQWLRNHEDLETNDLVNLMRRVSSPVHLPGVVLNMGRWRKPSLSERAA